MRGKWAQGLRPRNFLWIVKEQFAVSERPGGYGRNHRTVRRSEELIWLRGNEFTHIVSILDGPHNLQAYEATELPYYHVPLRRDEIADDLQQIYLTVGKMLEDPTERVLMHDEEFGDRLCGVISGFLLYNNSVSNPTHAIQLVERLTQRVLGPVARGIVRVTDEAQIRA